MKCSVWKRSTLHAWRVAATHKCFAAAADALFDIDHTNITITVRLVLAQPESTGICAANNPVPARLL